jgi:PUA-like domain
MSREEKMRGPLLRTTIYYVIDNVKTHVRHEIYSCRRFGPCYSLGIHYADKTHEQCFLQFKIHYFVISFICCVSHFLLFYKNYQMTTNVAIIFQHSKTLPHGGKLVNTMLKTEEAKNAAIAECQFELELDERQLCDVELLMQGGFSPLTGYMEEKDYRSVVDDLKLSSGLIFGLVKYSFTNFFLEIINKIIKD